MRRLVRNLARAPSERTDATEEPTPKEDDATVSAEKMESQFGQQTLRDYWKNPGRESGGSSWPSMQSDARLPINGCVNSGRHPGFPKSPVFEPPSECK